MKRLRARLVGFSSSILDEPASEKKAGLQQKPNDDSIAVIELAENVDKGVINSAYDGVLNGNDTCKDTPLETEDLSSKVVASSVPLDAIECEEKKKLNGSTTLDSSSDLSVDTPPSGLAISRNGSNGDVQKNIDISAITAILNSKEGQPRDSDKRDILKAPNQDLVEEKVIIPNPQLTSPPVSNSLLVKKERSVEVKSSHGNNKIRRHSHAGSTSNSKIASRHKSSSSSITDAVLEEEREPMRVFLRVRPFTPSELRRGEASRGSGMIQINVPTSKEKYSDSVLLRAPEGSFTYKNLGGDATPSFSFMRVFGDTVCQQEYFRATTLPLVTDFLSGQNALMFAYGITNAGKTFTIEGPPNQPGILPRTLDVVFNSIESRLLNNLQCRPRYYEDVEFIPADEIDAATKANRRLVYRLKNDHHTAVDDDTLNNIIENDDKYSPLARVVEDSAIDVGFEGQSFSVWVSYTEIYQEVIYDLLTPGALRPSLKLGEDSAGNVYIKGATHVCVRSADEAYSVMCSGQKHRRVSMTKLNDLSSRSHAIFTITILRVLPEAPMDGGTQRTASSSFSFVDLAGSERFSRTESTGNRLKEAANINSSLLVLGRCMEAMMYNKSHKSRPVPFRESKLTRLFQNFFSDRGKAAMTVNVDQCASDFDENLQTFRFANIARQVTTMNTVRAKVKTNRSESVAQRLADELQITNANLMEQLKEAKTQLAAIEHIANEEVNTTTPSSAPATPLPNNNTIEITKLKKRNSTGSSYQRSQLHGEDWRRATGIPVPKASSASSRRLSNGEAGSIAARQVSLIHTSEHASDVKSDSTNRNIKSMSPELEESSNNGLSGIADALEEVNALRLQVNTLKAQLVLVTDSEDALQQRIVLLHDDLGVKRSRCKELEEELVDAKWIADEYAKSLADHVARARSSENETVVDEVSTADMFKFRRKPHHGTSMSGIDEGEEGLENGIVSSTNFYPVVSNVQPKPANNLDERIDDLEDDLKDMRDQLELQANVIEEKHETIESLERQIASAAEQHDKIIIAAIQQIASLQFELNDANIAVEESEHDINALCAINNTKSAAETHRINAASIHEARNFIENATSAEPCGGISLRNQEEKYREILNDNKEEIRKLSSIIDQQRIMIISHEREIDNLASITPVSPPTTKKEQSSQSSSSLNSLQDAVDIASKSASIKTQTVESQMENFSNTLVTDDSKNNDEAVIARIVERIHQVNTHVPKSPTHYGADDNPENDWSRRQIKGTKSKPQRVKSEEDAGWDPYTNVLLSSSASKVEQDVNELASIYRNEDMKDLLELPVEKLQALVKRQKDSIMVLSRFVVDQNKTMLQLAPSAEGTPAASVGRLDLLETIVKQQKDVIRFMKLNETSIGRRRSSVASIDLDPNPQRDSAIFEGYEMPENSNEIRNKNKDATIPASVVPERERNGIRRSSTGNQKAKRFGIFRRASDTTPLSTSKQTTPSKNSKILMQKYAPPSSEKKRTPATPINDQKITPAAPISEKKRTPAMPINEQKSTPAAPISEKKRTPAIPINDQKSTPAALSSEQKKTPATSSGKKRVAAARAAKRSLFETPPSKPANPQHQHIDVSAVS